MSDPPLRIEREDGVVLDRFHQQPKPVFALEQRVFLTLGLRQVSRDLGEAKQLAVAGPHRGYDEWARMRLPSLRTRHPPVFAAAVGRRSAKLLLRACRDNVVGVKISNERPTISSAGQPLMHCAPGLPGLHATVHVEHEDRA